MLTLSLGHGYTTIDIPTDSVGCGAHALYLTMKNVELQSAGLSGQACLFTSEETHAHGHAQHLVNNSYVHVCVICYTST